MHAARRALRRIAPLALIAPGWAASCGEPALPPPNLILVSLDTLRSDRLSCYGYARTTSPRLDAFAREGALFEHAVAEAPWTLPSHATMLTGLYPSTHGTSLPSRRLGEDTTTLAQILSARGFATIGLTEGGFVGRDYGFARGFDVYSENRPDLATTLDTARELLVELREREPWFLFLHTFDIHCPYEPPGEHLDEFRTPGEEPVETEGLCGRDFNALRLTPGQVRALSNRYDASIHSVDALLGDFMDELEEAGELEHTYVVVTSDHGEQFYEHGRIGHERSVHRESLRVPWIVRGPGITPRRIRATAGLVDMTPTVLELLGVPVPASMEGRSRAGWLLGTEAPPEEAQPRFSQLSWRVHLQSVLTPTHQLIVDRDADRSTLYEFPDATGETVLEEDSFLERELRELLEAHLARSAPRRPATVDELDPEQAERLRALGYGE